MNEYTCPNCGNQGRRVRAIVDEGTFSGGGSDSGGNYYSSSGSSTLASSLSRNYDPKQEGFWSTNSIGWLLFFCLWGQVVPIGILALLGWMLSELGILDGSLKLNAIVMGTLLIITEILWFWIFKISVDKQLIKANEKHRFDAYCLQRWNRSVYCHTCQSVFIQNENQYYDITGFDDLLKKGY